jgi:hypothetical protein
VTLSGASGQTATVNGDTFYGLVSTNASVSGVTFADAWTATNFTAETASSSLIFNAATTFTVSGTLTLDGQAQGTEIILNSSDGSSRFTLDVTGGAAAVSYVDVSNSNASSNDITALSSIDRANNDSGEGTPEWVFSDSSGNLNAIWHGFNF